MEETFTAKMAVVLETESGTSGPKLRAATTYRELSDPKAEVERLFSAKGFHLLYDKPTEYKASAWEVVHSRRNKDGSLTQRIRPVQEVHVFNLAEPDPETLLTEAGQARRELGERSRK